MRRNLRGQRRRDAIRDAVVARQFDAEDEIAAAIRTDRGAQFDQQSRTARKVAAVFVFAPVRSR